MTREINPVPPHAAWRELLPQALLALLVICCFSVSFGHPFLEIWDDPAHVTGNPRLGMTAANVAHWLTHPMMGVYMPLTMWSYMLDHLLWGVDPLGYRLQNLFWHLAAVAALYNCMRHFKLSATLAFVLTLCFAIHPQRVESVVWMSERKDTLCAALYFWAVFFYLKGLGRPGMLVAANAFCLLALLAKPMAVSLPFVFLCVEFSRRRGWREAARHWWGVAPAFVFVAAVMLVTVHTQSDMERHVSWAWRLFTIPHNVYWYVAQTFFPVDLMPIYPLLAPTPGTVVQTLVFYLTALAFLAWLFRSLGRGGFVTVVLPLLAAFLVSLVPVVGVMPVGAADFADRYSYIPSAFLWLGVALMARRVLTAEASPILKMAFGLGAAAYAAFLAVSAILYMTHWHDAKTLFLNCLSAARPNAKAVYFLGQIGVNRNDPALLELAGNLLVNMARDAPESPQPGEGESREPDFHTGLFFKGMGLFDTGKLAEALGPFQELETAFHRGGLPLYGSATNMPRLWRNLAACYMATGKRQDALRCLRLQLPLLQPASFEASFCRGMIAFLLEDQQTARSEWIQALKLNPEDQNLRHNLANLEAMSQRTGAAAERK